MNSAANSDAPTIISISPAQGTKNDFPVTITGTNFDNPKVLYHPFGIAPWDPTASSIAVRKGDPDALNFLDNWILYHELDGWLQETHDKWFKTRDWKKLVE